MNNKIYGILYYFLSNLKKVPFYLLRLDFDEIVEIIIVLHFKLDCKKQTHKCTPHNPDITHSLRFSVKLMDHRLTVK